MRNRRRASDWDRHFQRSTADLDTWTVASLLELIAATVLFVRATRALLRELARVVWLASVLRRAGRLLAGAMPWPFVMLRLFLRPGGL